MVIRRFLLGCAGVLFAARTAAATLPPTVEAAVDAVLACERPGGGWTYSCDPPTGPEGAVTSPVASSAALKL